VDPSIYLDRGTWVHRLDPRTKMFLLIGTFVLAYIFLDPSTNWSCLRWC